MNLADSIAIEHSIADVLLKCLSQGLDPGECAFHLERRAIDFFQNRRNAPNRAISPVILEAIATFATAHPHFAARALSSLLVLATSSVMSWKSVTASKIFRLHPELFELLSKSIVKENECLCFLALTVTAAISHALIELSSLETFEKHDRLRILPVTPASLAVKGYRRSLRDEQKLESSSAELMTKVLNFLPLKALESISDDDWCDVLDLALDADITAEIVNMRTLLALARDSPARPELLRMIRKHPESSMVQEVGRNDPVANPRFYLTFPDKIFSSLVEINTAEKAYQLVRRSCVDGDVKSVRQVSSKWMSKGKMDLVAGAYLAAPSILRSLVDNNNVVWSAIKELPGMLLSPVDEDFDTNLTDLLATVPELSRLLSKRNNDNGNSAQLALKRLALMHPFLVARRLTCLSSATRTILWGLTDYEQRYKGPCLRVLEIVFEVISTLPTVSLEAREHNDLCCDMLEFLLDENRAENGVPDMFGDLATAIFKTLTGLTGSFHDSRISQLISKVAQGAGTSSRIKEAAEPLLHLQ